MSLLFCLLLQTRQTIQQRLRLNGHVQGGISQQVQGTQTHNDRGVRGGVLRLQGTGEYRHHVAARGQADSGVRVHRQGARNVGGKVLHHCGTLRAAGQNQEGFLHAFVGVVLEFNGCRRVRCAVLVGSVVLCGVRGGVRRRSHFCSFSALACSVASWWVISCDGVLGERSGLFIQIDNPGRCS